jgi:hypothetical protein
MTVNARYNKNFKKGTIGKMGNSREQAYGMVLAIENIRTGTLKRWNNTVGLHSYFLCQQKEVLL